MENSDKILIYDDDCPLCVTYTNVFVKSGLLTKDGRKSFSAVSPELLHTINWQRSVNEIPLLDPATKQVWYGIDALLEILGQKCALIKTIGNIRKFGQQADKMLDVMVKADENWFLGSLLKFFK